MANSVLAVTIHANTRAVTLADSDTLDMLVCTCAALGAYAIYYLGSRKVRHPSQVYAVLVVFT